MAKAIHTCTGCVPIDASIIEAYVALITMNKNVSDAEDARVEAEDARVLAENARVNAEASRVDVESSRVNAEAARALAENARVEAETARETQAVVDHTRAEGDHEVAADDHIQAGEDHAASSAATDRANEAAAAAEHMVDIKQGPKGDQGNTGSSVDYPYELVNNLTTDDATKGLSAAQGVVLDGKISQLGQYVENPKWVKVVTDSEDKILYGIKTDGKFYFGGGCPPQVQEYIQDKIDELSLDEYEDIVAFLNGLEKGDKTLQQLLDEKVDGIYTENPEFIEVKTDFNDKVIEGIKGDGTKVFGADVEIRGKQTVDGVEYTIITNPEWIAAWTDANNKILIGIKTDGSTYCGNINLSYYLSQVKKLIDSKGINNVDWNALSLLVETDNPVYIKAETDSEGKLLAGRTADGAAFECVGFSTPKIEVAGIDITDNVDAINSNTIIEDLEERSEITTDAEGKVISYRKKDGTKVENIGIEANDIKLGEAGKNSIIDIVKAKYPNQTVWSDKESLEISTPKCAVMNITNIDSMPVTKTTDGHAIIEVWDMQGNYFKKTAIINAQGNSSLSHAKKNFALDFLNGEWDEDNAFKLKIGKWVTQDSFHFKAYYTDFFVGVPVIGYQLYNDMVLTRGIYDDRCWKRALLPSNQEIGTIRAGMSDYDYDLCLDSGARCFPDGFPVIVYLNGEYYGIFCWQLKKHRDNYHQTKDNGRHIHLDGNICSDLLWTADGTIDWFKWAGITYETGSLNHDGIEIRNPKDLVLRNGGKYDFDTIHAYPSTADVKSIEPVGEEDSEYATLMAEAEAMTDPKKRTKRIAALQYTAAAKASIISLSKMIVALQTAKNGGETRENIRTMISTYFDVDSLIDYQIFCDITNNSDGIKKNWQWNTWDGDKWAVSPYDLDGIIGLYGTDGSADQQPRNNHIGGTQDNPCYWIQNYFTTELEARYAELRNLKVIDAERISSELNNWTLNIGLDNYKRELAKWPNRRQDNIYRFRNWMIESIGNMDGVYHYNS